MALSFLSLEAANQFFIKIDSQKNSIKVSEFRDWNETTSIFTDWVNKGEPYESTDFEPAITNQTENFIQTKTSKQDQEQTEQKREFDSIKKEYKNVGEPIVLEQTINITNNREIIVNLTNWTNSGSYYNCGSWSPNKNTIEQGTSFTKNEQESLAQFGRG